MGTMRRVKVLRFPYRTTWDAAANDTGIYLSEGRSTHALDPVTFEERWSAPSRDYHVEFVSGDTLIDQSYPDSRVRALDGATGRVLWSAPTYGHVSPWRGGVFVNSEDPTAYTLHRLSDGRVQEHGHFPSEPWARLDELAVLTDTKRRVLRGFAPDSNGDVWECPLPMGRPSEGPIVFCVSVDHRLVVLRSGKGLHAVDLARGETLWKTRDAPAGATIGHVIGRHLLVSCGDRLLSLDARTGEEEWNRALADYGDPVLHNPPLEYGDELLMVGSDHAIWTARLSDGSVTGVYRGPKSIYSVLTWKDLVIVLLQYGRVDLLRPAVVRTAATRKSQRAPAAQVPPGGDVPQPVEQRTPRHRRTSSAVPRSGEPKVLPIHSIRPRSRRLRPWLATEKGLVVSDGQLATTLGFRAETLTLYSRRGRSLDPLWEARGHWSPRFVAGDRLIVVDGPGDLVGACSLEDGRLCWATSSHHGAVWQAEDALVVWNVLLSEAQLVRPRDGAVIARHRLPRPYVHGLVGDVLIARDAWPDDGAPFRRVARAKRPRGACVGLDVRSGRTLWEHDTDLWFGEAPDSGDVLDHYPDPLEPPADLPPLLLFVSSASGHRVRRGVSARDLTPRWTAEPLGSDSAWVPQLDRLVLWHTVTTAGMDVVEELDLDSGRIERLAEAPPPTRGRGRHEAWEQFLGCHGRSLVFQNAQRCIDLLDRQTRVSSHYLLPRPLELDGAGESGGQLVLHGTEGLDVVDLRQ
jgi:hypothetical protein